jgi:hypothetical protein
VPPSEHEQQIDEYLQHNFAGTVLERVRTRHPRLFTWSWRAEAALPRVHRLSRGHGTRTDALLAQAERLFDSTGAHCVLCWDYRTARQQHGVELRGDGDVRVIRVRLPKKTLPPLSFEEFTLAWMCWKAERLFGGSALSGSETVVRGWASHLECMGSGLSARAGALVGMNARREEILQQIQLYDTGNESGFVLWSSRAYYFFHQWYS